MKKSLKILWLMLSVCLAMSMVACGGSDADDDDTDPSGDGAFVMHCAYVNLTGKQGTGGSGAASGEEMVQQDPIDLLDENATTGMYGSDMGYYVAYTYNSALYFDFVFDSSVAITDGKLVLRLAADIGTQVVLTDEAFAVEVNGTALEYAPMTLANYRFGDFVITESLTLNEGTNTITLRILDNELRSNGECFGPMIDCVKITGTADFDWQPVTSNLDRFQA